MSDLPRAPFHFDSQLDADYLESLFGDDLDSIKEIFNSFLIDTRQGYDDVQAAYTGGDLKLLRQKIHKIKPTFGFVGLTGLTHQCEEVIAACDAATGTAQVEASCKNLFAEIEKSFVLIESEVARMDTYNAS